MSKVKTALGITTTVLLLGLWACKTESFEGQMIFPDNKWMQYRTPEDAGWSSFQLTKAKAQAEETGSPSILIIYKGAVLQAWGDASRRFFLHSARKSTLSALIGIYASKNRISLSSTLLELGVDEITPLTDVEKQATVEQLITGYSGIYLPSVSGGSQFPERGSDVPGTRWFYNNWNYNALNTIFQNQTGVELTNAFITEIASPLFMEDFRKEDAWYISEKRSLHPAYHLNMSSRDWARFGLLYLNNGKWKSEQIVPESWVKASTISYSPKEEKIGYGYCWWIYPEMNMYASEGWGGHMMMIFPAQDLIIVHRANTYIPKPISWEKGIKQLAEAILKARQIEINIIDPSSLIEFRPNQKPAKYDPDPLASAKYEKYYDNNGDPMTIKRSSGRLILSIPYFGNFDLHTINDSTFFVSDQESLIRFKHNAQGDPIEMVFEE